MPLELFKRQVSVTKAEATVSHRQVGHKSSPANGRTSPHKHQGQSGGEDGVLDDGFSCFFSFGFVGVSCFGLGFIG